ncbi:HNH endonuclease [Streptomyces sp. NPDC020377]|uniref:HNH endonuclease n=1 Tax=Streptomyces sp. NPDC020377 TaxID=3365070 RepID=UPI00378B377B
MPTSPPSRCTEGGCHEIATVGSRCDEHKPVPWRGRDDKAARYGITSGEWRKLKRRVTKRDHGCCYRCGADQEDVMADDPEAERFVLDHIVPIFEGGSRKDLDNLGLLCPPCDEVKSKAEAARANRARKRGPKRAF